MFLWSTHNILCQQFLTPHKNAHPVFISYICNAYLLTAFVTGLWSQCNKMQDQLLTHQTQQVFIQSLSASSYHKFPDFVTEPPNLHFPYFRNTLCQVWSISMLSLRNSIDNKTQIMSFLLQIRLPSQTSMLEPWRTGV